MSQVVSVSKMDGADFTLDLPQEEAPFWATVEHILNEGIPMYLKRIISAAGYARFSVIKGMAEDFKSELEEFARTHMTMFEKSPENFHIFCGDPRDFRIVPGHWKLLSDLQKKLPDNKKQFLKLQHKVSEAAVIADQAVASRRIPPNIPPSKPESKPSGNMSSSASTSGRACGAATGSEESTMLIYTKIEAWMRTKKLEMDLPELPSKLQINVLGRRRATVMCFLCTKTISLSTRDNKSGSWGWIVSNYTQHILQHASNTKNTLEKYFQRTAPTVEPVGGSSATVSVGDTSNKTVVPNEVPQASDEPEINVPLVEPSVASSSASSKIPSTVNSEVQGTAVDQVEEVAPVTQFEQEEYIIYEEDYGEDYEEPGEKHEEKNAHTVHLNISVTSENLQESSEFNVEQSEMEPQDEQEIVGTLKTEYN